MSANLLLKQDLSPQQLAIVASEFNKRAKSHLIAYLLWFFLGVLGGHRFYSRNTIRAIFMLITLGGLGVWWLIDVFFIGKRIDEVNERIELEVIKSIRDGSC